MTGDGIVFTSLPHLLHMRTEMAILQLAQRHSKALHGGAYHAVFKGRGMDFAESRLYQAGDDIRSIDWRVTARTGKVHTKIFEEERERPVMLWVDMRPAMFFATQCHFKSVLASEIAALLIWKTLDGGDRIGGFVQEGQFCAEMKPMQSRAAALHLLRQLAHSTQHTPLNSPDNEALLLNSWSRLRQVATQGTKVLIISDFRGVSARALQQLVMMRRHAEVMLIAIHDPFEQDLPKAQAGRLRLTDGRRSLWVNLQARWLKNYQQRAELAEQQLQDFARSYRIPLVTLSTAQTTQQWLRALVRGGL